MQDPSRVVIDALEARLRAIDPDLVDAADDIDPAYLAWCRDRTPRELLVACRNAARGLHRIRRGASR